MKRARSFSVISLSAILLLFTLTAHATDRLEIVQARQEEEHLILYALLTDMDTGAVVSPEFADVKVTAGALGGGTVTNTTSFRNTQENTAYAVIVDLNSLALNANRLANIQKALQTLLYGMRSGDRMMLITTGQSSVNVLTNGFEKEQLQLNSLIEGMTNAGRGRSTQLYKGLERALTGFSSTEKDFPQRKVVVALAYGADNSGIAADVIASKAGASGVPLYFVTMKGSDQGSRKNADTKDLDRIARASHGRVISGHEDLSAACALVREYVASTAVLTVKPSDSAWKGLSGKWRITATIGGQTVTNDSDMDFPFTLQPSPSPVPTKAPTKAPTAAPTAEPTAATVSGVSKTAGAKDTKTTPPTQAQPTGAGAEATAQPAPTLLDKLSTPPLLYVAIGAGALLLVLIVVLVAHQSTKAKQAKAQQEDMKRQADAPLTPFDPKKEGQVETFGADGDKSIGLFHTGDGDSTMGMFDVDLDATLGMDQKSLKIVAEITYQGQTRKVPVRITKEAIFGRDKACDIQVEDPHVSRRHGKFIMKPDGLYVADTGSLSGTKLNGQPLTTEMAVRNGDVITIGATTIKLDISI